MTDLRMFVPDVSYSLLLLGISFLTVFTKTSHEFSGYLSRVLRNYTEQACDGDFLTVRCPLRTSITIQSAFYGRKDSAHSPQCPPTYNSAGTRSVNDITSCHVSTSLQKMLDECEDRRSCHVLVNSRLFGTDPCPTISKYLSVLYKCRPNEYKSKVVCEGERLRLGCKTGMQIAVYSAMFGRTQQGTLECPPHHRRAPSVDCSSDVALHVMTSRCQGKRTCVVRASTQVFGDPCYRGTRKYLSVIHTCVPKKLLQESVSRRPSFPSPPSLPHDPNVVGDSGPPDGTPPLTSDTVPGRSTRGQTFGLYSEEPDQSKERERDSDPNPTVSTVSRPAMALISSALAAYTYITEHPEHCALYFMCGVCAGLFLTLFALVVQISCRTDCKPRHAVAKKRPRPADSDSDTTDSDSDWDTGSDLSARRHRRFERTLNTNVFMSAEELERAQRLEERERIIREIWMNGQPDVPGTRSLNRYY
ncbi:protein eva-1 homolog C-like isoform X2 [Myxocyprinus asiaticus]|uniref:protein eva-1 homolog C-like isoform X2 n=2 Tax=Myxocyprinus asiaticus TaxID=70543 RepID=UPI002222CBB7|nr:protein eva-1 homolog C-like isoform X2 [Myxocyprinus asiaticus]